MYTWSITYIIRYAICTIIWIYTYVHVHVHACASGLETNGYFWQNILSPRYVYVLLIVTRMMMTGVFIPNPHPTGLSMQQVAGGGYTGPGYYPEESYHTPPTHYGHHPGPSTTRNQPPDDIRHENTRYVHPYRPQDHRHKEAGEKRDSARVSLISSDYSGEESWRDTWTTGVPLIVSYFIAVVFYLIFYHLKHIPTELPFPATGNLLDWDKSKVAVVWWNDGSVLVLFLWCFIHLRKFLLIVLSLRLVQVPDNWPKNGEPENKRAGIALSIFLILFNIFMGGWMGWASNVFCGYNISDLPFVLTGLIIFIAGEVGNISITIIILRWKQQRTLRYKIIKHVLDIVSWIGFCTASLLLPALVILCVRVVITVVLLNCRVRPMCCWV